MFSQTIVTRVSSDLLEKIDKVALNLHVPRARYLRELLTAAHAEVAKPEDMA